MIIKKLKKYKQKLKQIALLELRLNRLKMSHTEDERIVSIKTAIEDLKLDLQELDIALECLKSDEIYLVKEHFVMGREWVDIEITFNKNFRDKPEVTHEALKKKAHRALKTLSEFYKSLEELGEVI